MSQTAVCVSIDAIYGAQEEEKVYELLLAAAILFAFGGALLHVFYL